MLQKLNERIQGAVAWLVVVLIGITFTLFGVDYYLQSRQITNSKVTVNGKSLTEQTFETNYRRARGMKESAQITAEDDKKLQNQVLDQMVTNEVLIQAAHKNGFEVSANQANSAIVQIPQFQEDGHFSTEKYQQALSAALYTQISFQNEVRQGMLLNQQRFAFIGSSFALPNEIDQYVKLNMQTRDYDYLTVSVAHFEKKAQVTPGAIENYYKQHPKEFMSPEQVSVNYVLLSMNDVKKKIKISADDVKQFYDENQNNYLTPAQWKVAHILFAIPKDASQEVLDQIKKKADDAHVVLQKKPAQFSELVSSLSDDKLSVAEKGELPWIIAGQNEYDKILSQLTKPGEISAPEQTKHGYEIFKLIAYKPVTMKPLAEVELTIKEQLLTELAQTKYAQALEQLSDLSYQSPDSLNPVSDIMKLKIDKTASFSRAGGLDNLTKNHQVINAAFSHDVLVLGNNSEPIQLDNDSVAVVRVNEHFPEKEQAFNAVQAQINLILTRQIAEAKAKEFGDNLFNLHDEAKQKALINANKLIWKSVKGSTRESDKTDALINDMAFNLVKVADHTSLTLANGDYVIVKLKNISNGKLNTLDKEQRISLIHQIEAGYGTMDFDLYEKNLINHAQILKP